MRKVELCSYNKNWGLQFIDEAGKLSSIFQNEMIHIHHIGSTSVPGLSAKPVIDMMPVFKKIEKVDQYNEEMQDLGYEPKGENGIPGRRFFKKVETSEHITFTYFKREAFISSGIWLSGIT